ncbi:hypothetical protein BDY24DRAFT_415206 [Mrakia frigida]|uniref:uncharacterized protein n=1 Tax=Mrakia frigida TaxID=29902 RepID=UPI003FCBFE08
MSKISPSRRRLPWDVLLLVFKEADPPTLAVLGRVSYDFLTATAPELYRAVVVTSVKQLERLFCRRIERKTKNSSKIPSRINSHLSLSRIETLSIDFTSDLSFAPDSISISSSRLDDGRPIPLECLGISLYHMSEGILPLFYARLFPHLNPERCSYKIVGRPLQQVRWVHLQRKDTKELLGWTQIQTLDFSGVLPVVLLDNRHYLAGLPSPSPGQRRVVRLYVASLLSILCPDSKAFVDMMIGGEYSALYGLGGMQDGLPALVDTLRPSSPKPKSYTLSWNAIYERISNQRSLTPGSILTAALGNDEFALDVQSTNIDDVASTSHRRAFSRLKIEQD